MTGGVDTELTEREQRAEEGITEVTGGVTAPKGFRAAGIHCGIKAVKKDLALIVSEVPASGSAVLTTNKVQAAPILVVREQLAHSHTFRAIVVNSGNANACTGERGVRDAWEMVDAAASILGVGRGEVLPASTGVIGEYLPLKALLSGIPLAAENLSIDGGSDAAEAIMTTDTFVKECAVAFFLDGVRVTVGGIAKGSGMIAPNMATMLSFITTDASVEPDVLHHALLHCTQRSFNRITVDGDMSTNDMVGVLANGRSGAPPIRMNSGPAYSALTAALESVMVKLAKMIARDGEGATKFLEIQVTGAKDGEEALTAARSVANSNLVKTAMHGGDANWGRVLAAVGYSGIDVDPSLVEIAFGNVPILGRNYTLGFSEEAAREVLSRSEIHVTINLNRGEGEATCWTCDLSKEYVTINAHYRT